MAQGIVTSAIFHETLKKKGLVVLPLRLYERMQARLARLEEEARVLQIIAEGERKYKKGQLKPIKSLRELIGRDG